MTTTIDFSDSYKANFIVVVKDISHDTLVKSFIASTSLSQLWNELTLFYGSSNARSLKSGTLEDPVLLAPHDYKAIVLGEVRDTGVIKVFDTDISRGIDEFLSDFASSQWSKSREELTE